MQNSKKNNNDKKAAWYRKWPIGVIFAACVVWIASFLMWVSPGYISWGLGVSRIEQTAWFSSINFGTLGLPNWVLVFIATAICLMKIFEFKGFRIQRWIPVSLALYVLFHSGWFLLFVISSGRAVPGVGLILTFVIYIYFAITSIKKIAPSN